MQATALCLAPTLLPSSTTVKNFSTPKTKPPVVSHSNSRSSPVKATAATYETSTVVDYTSAISVFPAEACDTIGGDACLAKIYPEVKLKAEKATSSMMRIASELIEREYLEYNDPKTVLRGEACDVLGGEFCERAYQKGVY